MSAYKKEELCSFSVIYLSMRPHLIKPEEQMRLRDRSDDMKTILIIKMRIQNTTCNRIAFALLKKKNFLRYYPQRWTYDG